ncbi:hypothetical protein [Cellulomonas iranensis]|uniref:hypothetical protein n=1 Tax=Cellulomonas iranensis TaxID=76862 RepID=UPI000B3C6116|nr:hypothetical protein [Cellulomonas iranensis]
MGIVAESFDDLPPAAELPGADWGVPGWDELIVRYEAARRTLLAFDSEPADEIPHALVDRARELKSQIAGALRESLLHG